MQINTRKSSFELHADINSAKSTVIILFMGLFLRKTNVVNTLF